MPDCCTDGIVLLCAGLAYREYSQEQDRQREQRYSALGRLSQKALGQPFRRDWTLTGAAPQLPLGADSSASAALEAVERYEERARTVQPVACRTGLPRLLPTGLRLGPFRLGLGGGGGGSGAGTEPPLEPELAVCEDLKQWLRRAAVGTAELEELSGRLDFYRQVLMRPEIFSKTVGFFELVGGVCERLEELRIRRAGEGRGCAEKLGTVLDAGRHLIEGVISVLFFAIAETAGKGVSVDELRASALLARRDGADGGDELESFWATDCGVILQALLLAPHTLKVWKFKCDEASASSIADRRTGREVRPTPALREARILDSIVEVKHKWLVAQDEPDAGDLPEDCGLVRSFRGLAMKGSQDAFLDLCSRADDVVKFLSMIMLYMSFASLTGDAGIFALRERLHHLLQELQHACVQVSLGITKLMADVRKVVVETTRKKEILDDVLKQWLSRLQGIDQEQLLKSYRAFLDAIQEVRLLSSEARAPALCQGVADSLEEIREITSSEGFMTRCAKLPPQDLPLQEIRLLSGEARAPALAQGVTDSLEEIREPTSSEGFVSQSTELPPRDLPSQEVRLLSGEARAPALPQGTTDSLEETQPLQDPPLAARSEGRGAQMSTSHKYTNTGREDAFYDELFDAVLFPFFGVEPGANELPRRAARIVMERSGLSAATVALALELELGELPRGQDERKALVDLAGLKRVGRLLAVAQQQGLATLAELQPHQHLAPSELPRLDGVAWDEVRSRVIVTRPFFDTD